MWSKILSDGIEPFILIDSK